MYRALSMYPSSADPARVNEALGALQSEAFLQIAPIGAKLGPTHYLFECREL